MPEKLARFSTIVGLIYEAGLNPDSWPLALDALCSELHAEKAQLLYLDPREYLISFACGYGFDPYAHNIGAGRFRKFLFDDPVAQYGFTHVNEVFSDSRVIEKNELHESGMHKEIRAPADMEHLLTVFLDDDSLDWTGICFFRSRLQKPFSLDEESKLSVYKDHIRRATQIHKNISGSRIIQSIQNAIIDDLNTGVIVVDDLHDVIICNRSARDLIDNTEVFRLSENRLSCRNRRENSLFHEAIDEALSTDRSRSENRRIAIRLRGDKSDQSILAVSTPLQVQRFEEKIQSMPVSKAHYTARIPSRNNVLITLCDPASKKMHPANMLEHLFGLTPAEAALADCLADNLSLEQAAGRLQRSVGTARVQLQSIFEKTDTNRQSSLVRLIMAIP